MRRNTRNPTIWRPHNVALTILFACRICVLYPLPESLQPGQVLRIGDYVFYAGEGILLVDHMRPEHHFGDQATLNKTKHQQIRENFSRSKSYTYIKLLTGLSKPAVRYFECALIKHFGTLIHRTGPLTNLNNGSANVDNSPSLNSKQSFVNWL